MSRSRVVAAVAAAIAVPLAAVGVAAAGVAAAAPGAAHGTSAPARIGPNWSSGGTGQSGSSGATGASGATGSSGGSGQASGRARTVGRDWSGYAARGPVGSFDSVTANWTQPTVTCHGNADGVAAAWVGLDGFTLSPNPPGKGTTQQIGAFSDCEGPGKPVYTAWYDFAPSPEAPFQDPVKGGDKFRGSVGYDAGARTYTMTVTDLTQGWSRTVSKQVPAAARNSAEAIVELPGAARLAHFRAVPFSDVMANGEPIGSFAKPGFTLDRLAVGLNPRRPRDICDTTSSLTRERDFTVTWLKEDGCSQATATLKPEERDGEQVLAINGKGTVYTFSKDNGICSGSSCGTVWLPEADPTTRLGAGVPGELGSVSTPLGPVVTYDSHPLYLYVKDLPGEALGNEKHSQGGTWHVIVIANRR